MAWPMVVNSRRAWRIESDLIWKVWDGRSMADGGKWQVKLSIEGTLI